MVVCFCLVSSRSMVFCEMILSKNVNFVVLRVKFSCDILMIGFVQLLVFDFLRRSCAFAGILVVLWHLPVFVAVLFSCTS